MTWRPAKSLDVLLHQVDQMYPHRDKSSDGTIGDTRHQATRSDHNPNAAGVVCARDITHDPASGCDSYKLAEHLRLVKDPRVQYIISNRKIANMDIGNGAWRPYHGTNPHDHHVHVSVRQDPKLYDKEDIWNLGRANPPSGAIVIQRHPTLRLKSVGEDVKRVQYLVGMPTTGTFDEQTDTRVRAFQNAHALLPDGIVGPQTWKVLGTMSDPWKVV